MPPKLPKSCSCKKHNGFVHDGETFTVYNISSSKKFKKVFLNVSYDHDLLTPRSTYLCTVCADTIQRVYVNGSGESDQSAPASQKKLF